MDEVMHYITELAITFIISAVPIIELRGAIPFGLAHGVAWPLVLVASIAGNMLPVPFIMLFMRKMFEWLYRFKFMRGPIDWMNRRLRNKSETVLKYAALGLLILVAIPLPGTGAWTGTMVASILDMRMKTAVPAVFFGVVIAGIIVTVLSLSAIHVFGL